MGLNGLKSGERAGYTQHSSKTISHTTGCKFEQFKPPSHTYTEFGVRTWVKGLSIYSHKLTPLLHPIQMGSGGVRGSKNAFNVQYVLSPYSMLVWGKCDPQKTLETSGMQIADV